MSIEDNNKKIDPYAELAVSSAKEGVHAAIKNLSKGLYPGAFCKVVPLLGNYPEKFKEQHAKIGHADGVGTKSNVAYIARQEGFSSAIYETLMQDGIVMNTDDIAAVGAIGDDFPIYISNHVERNSNRFSDEDLAALINGYGRFINLVNSMGINVYDTGGETADVGSYVSTLGIGVTVDTVIAKNKIIDCSNIPEKAYVVGLASDGMSTYEHSYNSGIRSNGLTLAIPALLSPYYRKYPETMDSTLDQNKLYTGKYKLYDYLRDEKTGEPFTIVQGLLSPTRTYTPIIKACMQVGVDIVGIIHCSGGGMTKAKSFGNGIRYVKEQLLPTPIIFKAIREERNIDDEFMYSTFNMGTGMEIIVRTEAEADMIIQTAKSFNVLARIIGYTEKTNNDTNEVVINNGHKVYTYTKKIG